MPTSAVASMVSATVRASSPFLMARVGSVTMVRTPAGHTNVFPGRRSMTPVVPNARRVRTSSARSSLEDTHTTGPGCRRIARILQNKPNLRLAPRHLKAQGLDWSCPPRPGPALNPGRVRAVSIRRCNPTAQVGLDAGAARRRLPTPRRRQALHPRCARCPVRKAESDAVTT